MVCVIVWPAIIIFKTRHTSWKQTSAPSKVVYLIITFSSLYYYHWHLYRRKVFLTYSHGSRTQEEPIIFINKCNLNNWNCLRSPLYLMCWLCLTRITTALLTGSVCSGKPNVMCCYDVILFIILYSLLLFIILYSLRRGEHID